MDCFLEFISPVAAQRLVNRRTGNNRRCVLGGRHVTMELVNMDVLMKGLFPKARGVHWDINGVVERSNTDSSGKVEILSREELVMIVGHARTPHRVCLQTLS